jgi:hypothetical protein
MVIAPFSARTAETGAAQTTAAHMARSLGIPELFGGIVVLH